MNILYIASLQRFPGHHAGFTHAVNMAKGLERIGHEVHVLARADRAHPGGSSGQVGGMSVHYVDWPLKLRSWPGTYLRSRSDFRRFTGEWDIDIVHERFEMPFAICTFHSRRDGVPHVLEANSPFVEEFYRPGHPLFMIASFFRGMQFERTHRIIVQTPLLRKMFRDMTDTPVEVVPNGADPEIFSPGEASADEGAALRERYGIDEGDTVIGFSGSFRYWHGAQDLIAAMEHIRDGSARLLLMGGGRNLEAMKTLARRSPSGGRITFTGPVDHEQVPAHLRLCHILAAPFNTGADPLTRDVFARYGMWWSPLKIFEYMSVGRPVVSPDLGMIPEYLGLREKPGKDHGHGASDQPAPAGFTYPEGDARALAERIDRLMKNPDEARRMGENGRNRVLEKYSWEEQARKTVRIYEKVLGRTGT